MPKLRDYDRAELLALKPGTELDTLVHGVLGEDGGARPYSRLYSLVDVTFVKLREYWPDLSLESYRDAGKGATPQWSMASAHEQPDDDSDFYEVVRDELPHVCALALVLAAWEKEKP